jgi:hypothetical protein
MWRQVKGVYQMPLDEHAWLKYPVAKGRWYIEYRDDREKPETERTYGPFEGDPFERFGLEEKMAARLKEEVHSADDVYRIALMLKNGDRHLVARAFRLMHVALTDDSPIHQRQNYLPQFRKFLEDYKDAAATRSEDAAKIAARIAALEKEIDDLTLEFPRAEYASPDPTVMATVPETAWGEDLNGLRFASPAEPAKAKLGEAVAFTLVVENVSDRDIKFSARDLLQDSQVEALAADGRQVDVRKIWYSGWPPIDRYWLKPGERIVLAKPTIKFVASAIEEHAPGESQAIAAPGEYRVRYSIGLSQGAAWFRQDDGVMRRVMPAKGEWQGRLTSAYVPVTIEP